ncbi:MAG: hypothetical protein U0574_10970 [Phycisphaerales bacterium]
MRAYMNRSLALALAWDSVRQRLQASKGGLLKSCALAQLAVVVGCATDSSTAPAALPGSKHIAAAEERATRAQSILERVNAPLGAIRQGMTYEEVLELLRQRQQLVDQEPVLRGMNWRWSMPSHCFTVGNAGKSVMGVLPSLHALGGYVFVFCDDRLERILEYRALREVSAAPINSGQLGAARAMAQLALEARAVPIAEFPSDLTSMALRAVQRALGPPEFPTEVAVALAPIALVAEVTATRDREQYLEIFDRFNAVGIELGIDAAVLRERWGTPSTASCDASGIRAVLCFTSPTPPEEYPTTVIEVECDNGKVQAIYSGQQYVRQQK